MLTRRQMDTLASFLDTWDWNQSWTQKGKRWNWCYWLNYSNRPRVKKKKKKKGSEWVFCGGWSRDGRGREKPKGFTFRTFYENNFIDVKCIFSLPSPPLTCRWLTISTVHEFNMLCFLLQQSAKRTPLAQTSAVHYGGFGRGGRCPLAEMVEGREK